MREIVHQAPVWRDRSDFVLGARLEDDCGFDTEQLGAKKLDGGRYEICCIPFAAYDLALGDVVELDAELNVRRVVQSSGRYVFRCYFGQDQLGWRDAVVHELTRLGALSEWHSPRLISIDARDQVHAQALADYLHEQTQAGHVIYETGRS